MAPRPCREECCPKDWHILAFDLAREGPEHILTDETFALQSSGDVYRASCCCAAGILAQPESGDLLQGTCFLAKNRKATAVEARTRDSLSEAALWMDRWTSAGGTPLVLGRVCMWGPASTRRKPGHSA